MTMSEGDVAVVHGRQRQRQQQQSLFPHGDDVGGGGDTDGTQFIDVEMSEPSTESYGDLDDHHEHDDHRVCVFAPRCPSHHFLFQPDAGMGDVMDRSKALSVLRCLSRPGAHVGIPFPRSHGGAES